MSFFDKVKKSASDAADKVQGEVQEMKLKNEIVRTYEDLGRKTFELMDKGKLKNTTLNPIVKHLRELRGQLEAAERADWEKNKKA
jgi:hypothetical protein